MCMMMVGLSPSGEDGLGTEVLFGIVPFDDGEWRFTSLDTLSCVRMRMVLWYQDRCNSFLLERSLSTVFLAASPCLSASEPSPVSCAEGRGA